MAKPKSLPYEAPEQPGPYHVGLHSSAGGSDKVYRLSIEERDGLYVVNYANGRRGGTLKTDTRTPVPVPYAEARRNLNAQLYAKVGDGYLPTDGSLFGDGMAAEAIASVARAASGHVPQLAAPIDEEADLERFLRDDRWAAQPKHNGDRRFLIKAPDGTVVGGNRKGQTVALPGIVAKAAGALPEVVLDGEQVGDAFHYWDMPFLGGVDLRPMPLSERMSRLLALDLPTGPAIVPTETAVGETAKRALLARVRAANGEGLVFKDLSAPYEPGRPGSGATWRKFKLWKSLSAVVAQVGAKRSVGLELVDPQGDRVPVGNVTIPANHPIPAKGDVVEVRYLFAYADGGLAQPVFEGARIDVDASECLEGQRIYEGGREPAPAPAGFAP